MSTAAPRRWWEYACRDRGRGCCQSVAITSAKVGTRTWSQAGLARRQPGGTGTLDLVGAGREVLGPAGHLVNGHPVLLDRQRLAAAPVEVDAAVAPYGGAVSGYQPCGSVALRAEVERVRLAVLPTQPFERRLYLRAALAKRVAPGPDDRCPAFDRGTDTDDARVALVMLRGRAGCPAPERDPLSRLVRDRTACLYVSLSPVALGRVLDLSQREPREGARPPRARERCPLTPPARHMLRPPGLARKRRFQRPS